MTSSATARVVLCALAAWLPASSALQLAASPIVRSCTPRCSATVAAEPSTAPWGDLSDQALRLTDAQLTRTVIAVCVEGTLGTKLDAADFEGATFSSSEAFVSDGSGALMLGLSSEQAVSNLAACGSATFFVRAPWGGAAAGSSVNLLCSVEEMSVDDVSDADLAKLSAATGKSTEEVAARPWRKLVPQRVHMSDAVRAVEAWVPASEYEEAAANPLAPAAAQLLTKINGAKHVESLKRFAAVYRGIEPSKVSAAELLGVDQLGFDLRVAQVGGGSSVCRIGFRLPPANEEEGVSVFMKLFQEAYERQQGWM